MTPAYLLAPSILSADFARLGEEIAAVEAAGADWIHVDVMDGHFVPNLTMGTFIVEHVRRMTSLPIDVHLMVTNPEDLLEAFAKAGAWQMTVHVETCPNVAGTLQRIKDLGCRAGLTLNPATPEEMLRPALALADNVLVMSVPPGYSGQVFMPAMLARLATLRQWLNESHSQAWLEVDGGINATTIAQARQAGATAFVAANAIFKHPQGIAAGVAALREALAGRV